MKFFFLIVLCAIISFQTKCTSLHQTYKQALAYIYAGNLLATKRVITEQNLSLDKTIVSHAPLMHHFASNPSDDIENTQSIFKFINERADISQKDNYDFTILHKATKAKNIVAINTLAENKQYKKIMYEQDAVGLTALFHAGKEFCSKQQIFQSVHKTVDNRIQKIFSSYVVAALKESGYKLEEDPLYKQNKLPYEIKKLWFDDTLLNDALIFHKEFAVKKQRFLKNTMQEVIRSTGYQDPVQIQITNYDDLACARKYGKLLIIDISSKFEHFPFKKPLILHELAYHLLGYTSNHDHPNYDNKYLKDFQQQADSADDFVIQTCPQEFIDYCQFCLKNNIFSRVRSFQERKARAENYLKKN